MDRMAVLTLAGCVLSASVIAVIYGAHSLIVRTFRTGRYNVFHWIDLLAVPAVVVMYCIVCTYCSGGKSLSNLWTEMPSSCLAWCAMFAVRCVLVLFGVRWSNRTHAIVGLALALVAAIAIQFLVPPLPE